MVMMKTEHLVKTMLSDTILALCKNTLPYKGQFCVEGLLGITLDNKEIFLVHLNETIAKEGHESVGCPEKSEKSKNAAEESGDSLSPGEDSDGSQPEKRRRRRKRHRKRTTESDVDASSDQNIDGSRNENIKKSRKEDLEESRDSLGYSELQKEDSSVSQEINMTSGDRIGNNSVSNRTLDERSDIKEEECNEDSGDVVYIKEEPQDEHSFDMQDFSQTNSALYRDQSIGDNSYGQLQQLAMQLSADMAASSSSSAMLQHPSAPSLGSLSQMPTGGTSDQGELARRYACRYCGRQFKNKSNMYRHQKLHLGEKQHKCQLCGAGFTRTDALTLHMRNHTGERPYRCDNCDRGFTQKCNLIHHMCKCTSQPQIRPL